MSITGRRGVKKIANLKPKWKSPPMLWRVEFGIFRLNFGIDLAQKKKVLLIRHYTKHLNRLLLTFLNEGGTATPGGTEKHRPRRLLLQCASDQNSGISVLTVSLTRTVIWNKSSIRRLHMKNNLGCLQGSCPMITTLTLPSGVFDHA
jgi:hypothetical protein